MSLSRESINRVAQVLVVYCTVGCLYTSAAHAVAELTGVVTNRTILPKTFIKVDDATQAASLYVAMEEVLKISTPSAGLAPKERVSVIQSRLKKFIDNGGNARDIKPSQEGNQTLIVAGHDLLVTIDSQTAKEAGLSEKQLAMLWTNLIRRSLGAESLSRDDKMIASRSLTPSLAAAREIITDETEKVKQTLKGMASWYGPGFHGRRCSNGERFNMYALTAAHRTLPFGTKVRVTNQWTGKSAVVRITDRGPFAHGRVIDLSKGAAQAVGMLSSGTAPVKLEVLQ